MDLAEMQEMLAELQRARFSGARRVKFRERDVEYKSDAEMAKAISALKAEINKLSPPPSSSLAEFDGGFNS
ncbi:MAG: hypothetical protein J0I99_00700 [Devosia sp.]|uniref:phage head-tail joining protein n=1 Tax=Devosia sp. TaxID=1871048 RepID=UPI001ACB3B0F|nr:hypothetical protein [Devosia sp.]MBN9308730.1 hypothetical protein [Devosia sp.]MBN9314236.1 hypothetical protein [Devosia sp.]